MTDLAPQDLPVARLALCERAPTRGGIDGAWWPKSGDLRSELPDLVEVFGSWIGPVHRVVYDPSMWALAPPRIIRGKAVVSVDPYRLHARDTIYLKGTHSRDAVLFVLASSSGTATVRQVLRTVAESTQPMSVDGLRQLLHRTSPVVDCTSTGYMT
ncbi:DUF5994 family protein [uncultured Mycobacterium sp.]|uniref:DUF5994 family protein n=1 Tax=uncultured Mycobacterium sp. TaxID=171292 RepID=UPI0035CA2F57